MDIFETFDVLFEDLYNDINDIMEKEKGKEKEKEKGKGNGLRELLQKTKRSAMCIAAANMIDTSYIIDTITPTVHDSVSL